MTRRSFLSAIREAVIAAGLSPLLAPGLDRANPIHELKRRPDWGLRSVIVVTDVLHDARTITFLSADSLKEVGLWPPMP